MSSKFRVPRSESASRLRGQDGSRGSNAYATAGVSLAAADRAVELIAPLARSTHGPRVLNDIGAFGGLFALGGYREPVLVASTDGVGTKLKVAFAMDRHDTIGRDLVALSVNDVLTMGAAPLFFLDYIAIGRLVPEKVQALVAGMAEECRANDCALLGGETAEMPDMYAPDEYDLAGFVVGAVERDRVVDGSGIEEGDLVWALASSGLHTNGYTLARKVLADMPLHDYVPELGRTLGEELLEPHRSYLKLVQPLLSEHVVKGMAHISGGGLPGNLSRPLPDALAVELDWGAWVVLPIFDLIRRHGGLALDDMVDVFNLGVGFAFFSAAAVEGEVRRLAPEVRLIGRVVPRGGGPPVRFLGGS